VTLLQAWLFFGIPALALGSAMFVGRSTWRALVGYAILAAGFAAMTVFDRASGAVIGAVMALVYAAGRGGSGDVGPDPLSATGNEAAQVGG
jgi:hypothetical protein